MILVANEPSERRLAEGEAAIGRKILDQASKRVTRNS